MKNRWWLAGSCLLILTAVFVTVQLYATMGTHKAKPADAVFTDVVPDLQENTDLQVVSYGGQSESIPVIPPRSGRAEEPPREGAPSDEGRYPDVQPEDVQTEIPAQDDLYQEEPYQIVPPDEEYLDSLPPDEVPPAE